MANINLLPWRKELRKERQQEFLAILMAVALVAVVLILVSHVALNNQVAGQEESNLAIKSEIGKLDGQIAEIDALQKKRDELLARMKVIQDLQGHRPIIVRIFDELVRVLPDGVVLTALDRAGDGFALSGVAESPNQVSNLMRNLDASQWFTSPVLSAVVADASASAGGKKADIDQQPGSRFSLTVSLESPSLQDAAVSQAQEPAK
jgi:type IV pilus assembly protein PilN